jgi:hypothetical protein
MRVVKKGVAFPTGFLFIASSLQGVVPPLGEEPRPAPIRAVSKGDGPDVIRDRKPRADHAPSNPVGASRWPSLPPVRRVELAWL